MFKCLVLLFYTIIGIDYAKHAIFTECPNPFQETANTLNIKINLNYNLNKYLL